MKQSIFYEFNIVNYKTSWRGFKHYLLILFFILLINNWNNFIRITEPGSVMHAAVSLTEHCVRRIYPLRPTSVFAIIVYEHVVRHCQ